MATPTLADDEDEDEEDVEETESEDEQTEEEPEEEAEEQADDEGDEDEEDVEEVDLPEDADEVGDDSAGSLLNGSTFGISNKMLLGIGIAAILLVIILRASASGPKNASRDRYESDEDVEEELQEGSEGSVDEQRSPLDAGQSNRKYDEKQQEAAIDAVFDG